MHTPPSPLTVTFTDTSAEALRFSLDHNRLPPLASRHIAITTEGPSARLELHVIGSSHQVILTTETDVLTETFACLGDDADHRLQPTRPVWDRTHISEGAWLGFTQHRFRATCVEVGGDFSEAAAEVVERAAALTGTTDHHLAVTFPGQTGALTALALTCTGPDALGWQSWHCYPQHRQIVHSTSELRRLS